ncbi:mannonate dehydratase [Acidaminobacter hydrogenoformans DSM 2784]|uniref:Mannonate dehydratase n=2 Tax=Acidaminobacter TaxID=65402 RepID=A0A1G5RQZ9_9FIRM|nr:mannonate dehydratase [Acidaminobacter hydrogenoformans DSM 2784]
MVVCNHKVLIVIELFERSVKPQMKLSFRWYGPGDPVSLEHIRQIPGMKGIVSAIYDVPVGDAWPLQNILRIKEMIEANGMDFDVIESVPVHEDIKLGRPTAKQYTENYKQSLTNLSKAGIKTVCYNFMPVFDWTRSTLTKKLPDGSLTLAYVHQDVEKMDPVKGELDLPGWATDYTPEEMKSLIDAYGALTEEDLWNNLGTFLKEIIPVAEAVGIRMAIHPDDPPWSIFGLPRIIRNKASLERVISLIDSPSNGLAICTGSLGVSPDNDMAEIVGHFASLDRLNFLHARNVKYDADKNFDEVAHPSANGSLDMYAVIKAAVAAGYNGPIRPDHGRMIWGETGKPGYGLYDRALGATYLVGLIEAAEKELGSR